MASQNASNHFLLFSRFIIQWGHLISFVFSHLNQELFFHSFIRYDDFYSTPSR